jgi:ribosome-binding factor A
MNDRRLARLQEQIKARLAEVLLREVADPKLGMVTITRVELDAEFTQCVVYWSALGDEKAQRQSEAALRRARGFCQREVGKALHTRTVPRFEFRFDRGIQGAITMNELLADLRRERAAREAGRADPATPGPTRDEPPSPPADS